MDEFIGRHRVRRGVLPVVGRPRLGPLRQSENKHRPKPSGEKAQKSGADVSRQGFTDLVAQQRNPVCLVASLCRGEREEDFPFLPRPAAGQIAVHRGFRPLIREVLAPSSNLAW